MGFLPSRALPPLSRPVPLSSRVVHASLEEIASFFKPRKSAIARLRPTPSDSGYSTEVEYDRSDSKPAQDPFERRFAQDWLLLLLKRGDDWIAAAHTIEEERGTLQTGSAGDDDAEQREVTIEFAASLLSNFAETSASGAIHRPVTLPTPAAPIVITLLDALPSATDPTSVGLQSWGASIILARRLALSGLEVTGDPFRVLELGAGTGLVSLSVAKILGRLERDVDDVVVATDYHEAVLDNLRRNVKDNQLDVASLDSPVVVQVEPLDWSTLHSSPSSLLSAPFDSKFDLIFGADVIYGPDHARWIHSSVMRLLAFPSPSTPRPAFILIAPLRPTHTAAIQSITSVFPLAKELLPEREGDELRLAIVEVTELEREWGVGRADENGYRLFRIEWV